MKEIERKFLVDKNDLDLDGLSNSDIKQGYLDTKEFFLQPRKFIQNGNEYFAIYLRKNRNVLLKKEISKKEYDALVEKGIEERTFEFKENNTDNLIDLILDKNQPYTMIENRIYGDSFTIRLRTYGDEGFLTIKGLREGISRFEYETDFPVNKINKIIKDYNISCLEKTRYIYPYKGKKIEIDFFSGILDGLCIGEIELSSENEEIELPSFLIKDVSEDDRYANNNLLKNGIPNEDQ